MLVGAVRQIINEQGLTRFQLVAQIAPWSGGRINMKYRRVSCTPPSSIKLQLLNVNGDDLWLRMTVQVTPPPD